MKVALVTGGSRGIGAETVKKFARNGYTVILNYLKSDGKAVELRNSLLEEGCDVHLYKADVSDVAQTEERCFVSSGNFSKGWTCLSTMPALLFSQCVRTQRKRILTGL